MYTNFHVISYIVIIVITINIILLFCSNKMEIIYHVNDEYSLNTNKLTLVTAVDNNYVVHNESNKAVTDIPNPTCMYI